MNKGLFWVMALIVISPLVNAEYIPAEARQAAGMLHSPSEVKAYINQTFEYEYSVRHKTFFRAWKDKVGDCTEFNHVLAPYFLKEQGVKFTRMTGTVSCFGGVMRHDWLVLENGEVFDVLQTPRHKVYCRYVGKETKKW